MSGKVCVGVLGGGVVYPLFHNYMLVGCFVLNVSLGPCFSRYRAVSRKREKEK